MIVHVEKNNSSTVYSYYARKYNKISLELGLLDSNVSEINKNLKINQSYIFIIINKINLNYNTYVFEM